MEQQTVFNLAQVTTCILYQIMISTSILAVSGLVELSTRSRIAMLLNSESMVASFRQMLGLSVSRLRFFRIWQHKFWSVRNSINGQRLLLRVYKKHPGGEGNPSWNLTCFRMLRGLCDGEILLDSNLRVVGKAECLRTPSSCRYWFSCACDPDHLRFTLVDPWDFFLFSCDPHHDMSRHRFGHIFYIFLAIYLT